MERLDADVSPVECPLQETPEVFHRVGVYVTVNVFNGMIDYGVLIFSLKPFVRFQFIAEDSGTGFNLFVDVFVKFFLPAIVNHEGPNLPAALDHAHHDGLVFSASTSDALFAFRLVHVARLAADEGFVYFNLTAQLTAALFALLSKPDAVEQKPCGLLGDTERPRDFATADTVLCVLKHPHCRKPLVQTDGGIFHDGADLDGELAARVPNAALPAKLVGKEPDRSATAARADHAILPFRATRHEVIQAVRRFGKIADRFQQGLGFVKGFHTSSVPQNRVLVKYIFALFWRKLAMNQFAALTHSGTGTVRRCWPLPTKSTMAQWSSRELPRRTPSFFAPFTRRSPAANSGLSSPQSAASYTSRTAASLPLIVPGASWRDSR